MSGELSTESDLPFSIRPFAEQDWAALWPILRATFAAGDTYAFPPDSSEAQIHQAWIELPAATFVACDAAGRVLGSYFIKPNQPGLGAHVCNCGYIVASAAQGAGVATALCEHSQRSALALGFRAMQFNLVVATNARAIRLWRKLGFSVVGRVPRAFQHRDLGYVDALIMHKELVSCAGRNDGMDLITWDEFVKVELRVGRIVSAAAFPEARKAAYVLHIDFGGELGIRKSSAQITGRYRPDELIGKLVVAVLNLPRKQIGPLMSECLVTGFHDEGGEVVLCVPDQPAPLGAKLL